MVAEITFTVFESRSCKKKTRVSLNLSGLACEDEILCYLKHISTGWMYYKRCAF